jgi:DNA-binding response OmpR family regulator
VRVLIIEDDAKVADVIARALGEDGHTADVVGDGTAGERAARAGGHDVIVLDWMLPGMDGLSVCRALRQAGVRAPVLMLTARDEVADRVLGLDGGADDYMVKPFALEELLARVRALGRRVMENTGVLEAGGIKLDLMRRTVALPDAPTVELTGREFALLEYLVRNAGRPVSRSEILQQVWGAAFDPGTNVVDVYVRHLRDKLGDHGRKISTVRGVGYAFEA